MTRPLRAVITAGGTQEPVDDVRVLTNSSTGRFGAAIANALVARGVHVDLLASASLASHPEWLDPRVVIHPYTSHQSLDSALTRLCETPVDLLLMAAAVSDYRPVPTAGKIRSSAETLTLHLEKTPKILASLRQRVGPACTLVGFKLLSGVSTEELIAVAQGQRSSCALDFTVANDLATFAPGLHPVQLVGADATTPIRGSKADTARQLVDHLLAHRRSGASLATPCPSDAQLDAAAEVCALQGLGPVTLVRAHERTVWVRSPDGTTSTTTPGPGPDPSGVAALAQVARRLGRVAVLTGPALVVDAPEIDAPLSYPSAGIATAQSWFDAVRLDDHAPDARFLLACGDRALGVVGAAPSGDCPDASIPIVVGQQQVGHLTTRGADTVVLRLAPDTASDTLEDRVFAAIDRRGYRLSVPLSRLADFTARGCRVLDRSETHATLLCPSQRDDLEPAVSVAVTDWSRRQILLGQRKTPPWQGTWTFPGGKVEPGETLLAAALRELREETGLSLEDHAIRRVTTIPVASENGEFAFLITHYQIDLAESADLVEVGDFAPRWVPLDQVNLLQMIPPGTRAGLRLLHLRDDNR